MLVIQKYVSDIEKCIEDFNINGTLNSNSGTIAAVGTINANTLSNGSGTHIELNNLF